MALGIREYYVNNPRIEYNKPKKLFAKIVRFLQAKLCIAFSHINKLNIKCSFGNWIPTSISPTFPNHAYFHLNIQATTTRGVSI